MNIGCRALDGLFFTLSLGAPPPFSPPPRAFLLALNAYSLCTLMSLATGSRDGVGGFAGFPGFPRVVFFVADIGR